MKKIKLTECFGFAQIFVLIGMLLISVSLPIATKVVQQNQENRSNAAEAQCERGDTKCQNGYKYTCNSSYKWLKTNSKCGGSSTTTPTCTYIYSSWSDCLSGKQTRNIMSRNPQVCNGNPVLEQACTVAACTGYTQGDWSDCYSTGLQQRTVVGIPAGCTGGVAKPETQRGCVVNSAVKKSVGDSCSNDSECGSGHCNGNSEKFCAPSSTDCYSKAVGKVVSDKDKVCDTDGKEYQCVGGRLNFIGSQGCTVSKKAIGVSCSSPTECESNYCNENLCVSSSTSCYSTIVGRTITSGGTVCANGKEYTCTNGKFNSGVTADCNNKSAVINIAGDCELSANLGNKRCWDNKNVYSCQPDGDGVDWKPFKSCSNTETCKEGECVNSPTLTYSCTKSSGNCKSSCPSGEKAYDIGSSEECANYPNAKVCCIKDPLYSPPTNKDPTQCVGADGTYHDNAFHYCSTDLKHLNTCTNGKWVEIECPYSCGLQGCNLKLNPIVESCSSSSCGKCETSDTCKAVGCLWGYNGGTNMYCYRQEASVPTATPTPPNIPVSEIRLNQSSAALYAGETQGIIATVLPSNATDKNVSWSSSDSSIVQVNSGSLKISDSVSKIVTVRVTASTSNGKSASVIVLVGPKPISNCVIDGKTWNDGAAICSNNVAYVCKSSTPTKVEDCGTRGCDTNGTCKKNEASCVVDGGYCSEECNIGDTVLHDNGYFYNCLEGQKCCKTNKFFVRIIGVCGGVNKTTTNIKPTTNLCSTSYGNSAVVASSDPTKSWTWDCLSSDREVNATCYTLKPVATSISGECGGANRKTYTLAPLTDLCLQGTLLYDDMSGLEGDYNWRCLGSDGGGDVRCQAMKGGAPVVATKIPCECGKATKNSYSFAPNSDLCNSGINSTPILNSSQSEWSWICSSDTCSSFPCSAPYTKSKVVDTLPAVTSGKSIFKFKIAFAGIKPSYVDANGKIYSCLDNLKNLDVEIVNVPTNIRQSFSGIKPSIVTGETDSKGNQVFLVTLEINSSFVSANTFNYVKVKGPFHLKQRMCLDGQNKKLEESVKCDIDLFRTDGHIYNFSEYTLLAGDVNRDGVINGIDFSLVKNSVDLDAGIQCGKANDLNLDGAINSFDLNLVKDAPSLVDE